MMTATELDNSALRSTVAFTGRLACMTRAEAFGVVRSHGGRPSEAVTRQTNVLVVGELGWPLLDDGRPSNKLSRAGSYGIPVVRGRRFLEETGNIAEAERLYRIVMKTDPTDPASPFNLGNLLRANGRKAEAEAALRATTRADPTFAEAWYNLSDLLDEQGRSEAAIDCLRRALQAVPKYVDAMFNLALLLQRSNRHKEAA